MTIHSRLALLALLLPSCFAQAQLDDFSVTRNLLTDELLRVDEAFRPQALGSEGSVDVVWNVEPGYYLYRKQFRVLDNGEEVSDLNLPPGETAYDPFFDEELEIYRDEVLLNFPTQGSEQIYVRFQGCADAGYCYPPSWVAFENNIEGDSVTYLGLVDAPGETPAEVTTGASQTYLYTLVGLALLASLFWFGSRKFFRSSRNRD
jgi:LPXTG-motif cell wall-anchored protein